MTRALVVGATGYLGSYLVQELKRQGYWVRVIARNRSRLGDLNDIADDIVEAQVTDPETLIDCCENIDVVLSSIGITKQKDGLTFMDVDYQANMNLLDAAVSGGVRKFLYISVFEAHRMDHLKGMQAKLRFGEALAASGIEHCIVYPNGFFSDMREFFAMAQKGRGYVFGTGETRINPIHGADLAEVCVRAISEGKREIAVGGPDILTQNDILQLAFAALSKPPKISRIPHWFGQSFLALLRLFSSEKTYGPVEFFMTVLSRDMIAPAYGTRRLTDFYADLAETAEPEVSTSS